MDGTLLNTDVSGYVAAAWVISISLLGGLTAWAIAAAIRSDQN